MKLTNRILASFLSLIMAVSCFAVLPAMAESQQVNNNLTVIEPVLPDGKTNTESGYTWAQKAAKLYAGATLSGTTLQVDNITDSTLDALGTNNSIIDVTAVDSSGTSKTFNLTKVTDGDIFDGAGTDTADYYNRFQFPDRSSGPLGRERFGTDVYDAEITVSLNGIKAIDTIYAFAHPGTNLAWSTYKIYVGNSRSTLFSDENEVAYFDYYDAYKNTATIAWSLNGSHAGTAGIRRSEGQIWSFTGEKPVGKYVGYKVYLAETGADYVNRLDLFDIGVIGDNAYTIDAGSNSAAKVDLITANSNYAPFNLKVADITPTYLYENYADKNIIKSIEVLRNGETAYTDTATLYNISDVYAFDRMTDGKIYDASGTDPYNSSLGWYGQHTTQLGGHHYTGDKLHLDRIDEAGENYDAKLIMNLGSNTKIDTFYYFGHIRNHLTTTTYKVFAGNDKDTLFNAENEIALFDYANYSTVTSDAYKLNGANYSEGQIWSFTSNNKPQGKYVGLIVYDAASNTSFPDFLEIAELGVCGESISQITIDSDSDEIIASANFKSNLKVTDITPDFLTAERVANNALKNAEIQMFNNTWSTASLTGTVDSVTDGTMDTAGGYTTGSFLYTYNGLTNGANPEGYVTITLDGLYKISELYFLSSPRANTALSNYELYAAKTENDLYNPDNLVATYKYTGYGNNNTTGKLNVANGNKNSEGQIWNFTGEQVPQARYVGIKVYEGALGQSGWLYFSEMGLLGEKISVNIDTSSLNDETFLVPVGENVELKNNPYSFKLDVKNGGKITKVMVNDTELTPVEGVYTIEALSENNIITVETDRDEYATKNGMWNGLNLNLGSASYGTNIWDGDYVVHETAMFWSTRTTAKLLYPIENIVSIRSYDFKETYWLGEDFEVVDGQLKVLDGSRMNVLETTYDTVEYGQSEELGINWQNSQWKYQVRVTYTYSDTWDDTTYNAAPEGKLSDVAKFHKKAMSGEDTTVLFLGDSISVGCNSSGLYQPTYGFYDADGDGNLDFNLPAAELREKYQFYYNCFGLSKVPEWGNNSWAYQVVEGLKSKYNNDNIKMVNKAVGSTSSPWGSKKENLDFFLNGVNPDLVFIGYGMNESPRTSINAELRVIIDYIRNINPDCSVVLVSAFVPNYNSDNIDNNLDLQEKAYYELLEDYDNITIAPVNSVFHSLQTTKDPADYTGNNYNHPNDFGVSVYASTVLATLSGEVNPVKVTFTDNSGNVIHTQEDYGSVEFSNELLAEIKLKLPTIFGYEFVSWNDEIVTATEDKVYKAIYAKTTNDKYSVTAKDGEETYQGFHNFDARITAVAKGSDFSYWKDCTNGIALSAKQTYTFYVPGDISIETVYGAEDAVKPVTLNSSVQKILRTDGKFNLYFTGEISVPDGAELTSFGISYTNAETNIGNLETTETDMSKGVAATVYNSKPKNGPVMVILSGVKAGGTRYAKLFITYTLNGESHTVFTDCAAMGSAAE